MYCKYCHRFYKCLRRPGLCGHCKRRVVVCPCGRMVNKNRSFNNTHCLQCASPIRCKLCRRGYRNSLKDSICTVCHKKVTPIQFPKTTTFLNKEQSKIITHPLTQHASLLACAGSGKTTTLVTKIGYMIKYQHIPQDQIILATFTRNAAREMSERLEKLLDTPPEIMCGTFHSIAFRLLQKHDPTLFENRLLHIDELQFHLLNKLKQNIITQYKYLFVDEYQDINEVQYQIIYEFVRLGCTVIGVGDDGQNIYTFRGSDVKYILNFNTLFSKSTTYKLTYNYRSTNAIINVANGSIRKNKNSIPKRMLGQKRIRGTLPTVMHFDKMYLEIKWIVEQIEDLVKNGISREQIVVLTRNNKPLFYVEEGLAERKINTNLLMTKILQKKRPHCVTLSTIHSSKGLEWEYVFMMGCADSFFPASKLQLEEERRLFYVGVTRCKKELTITYSGDHNSLTRFVWELPKNLFDYKTPKIKYKLSDEEEIDPSNSVTQIISSLNGEDVIRLREQGILPDFDFKQKEVHKKYSYSPFIKDNNLYDQFGILVDYLLRRMIGGYTDRKAEKIIESLPLKRSDHEEFIQLYPKIYQLTSKELTKHQEYERMWMKRLSWKMNTFGHKTVEDVPITTTFHIPIRFLKEMERGYSTFKNKTIKWRNCLQEIYATSKAHSIAFGRKAVLYSKISTQYMYNYFNMFHEMDRFMKSLTKDKVLEFNPTFSGNGLCGEGDLLVNDCLIDFKVHDGSALEMENLLQLLTYVALGRNEGYEINKIALYNPLWGEYIETDVSEWNKGTELLEFLNDVRS